MDKQANEIMLHGHRHTDPIISKLSLIPAENPELLPGQSSYSN